MLKSRYRTACGGTIVVTQKARNHLEAHPEVIGLLSEGIKMINLPTSNEFLEISVDFGRTIGYRTLVKSPGTQDTPSMFAVRSGRKLPTRIAMDKALEESSRLVVVARPAQEDKRTYLLVTSFIGETTPSEPHGRFQSKQEAEAALNFWSNHALAYDPATMSPPFESNWRAILNAT